MEQDNIINVYDENGNVSQVEVLDIFSVDGFENKEYILYTKNVEADSDNIEAYVSILQHEGDKYNLLNIENDDEWELVQKAVSEMGELNEEF